jgi:hypothetical protein
MHIYNWWLEDNRRPPTPPMPKDKANTATWGLPASAAPAKLE